MRLFWWSEDFSLHVRTSLALVWVLLPNLRTNCYKLEPLKEICSAIGRPLAFDKATANFTRPIMAKMNMEIDLLKPPEEEIFIGFYEQPGKSNKGYIQKILYEFVPEYYTKFYRKGHSVTKCSLGVVPVVASTAAPVVETNVGDDEGKKDGEKIYITTVRETVEEGVDRGGVVSEEEENVEEGEEDVGGGDEEEDSGSWEDSGSGEDADDQVEAEVR